MLRRLINAIIGSLFQGRFQAIHVDQDEYLLNLTRYIHLNPVEANLVEKAEDWEFSSYQEYVDLRRVSLPKLDRVELFSEDAYRDFLEDANIEKISEDLTFEE
jgi:hypothetical protein